MDSLLRVKGNFRHYTAEASPCSSAPSVMADEERMGRAEEELKKEILALKEKRKAIILAHNYQLGEIQDIADFVGDSLELSRKASLTDAEVIVFCGVDFMAETASILCPDKLVIHPEPLAKCPMAAMITPEKLRKYKENYKGIPVVCYINSSAGVKAESDVCCTSANAVKVIEAIESESVIFVPDQYLGHYISRATKKRVILYPGYCPTHLRILPERVRELKESFPEAKVVVHPECRPDVIDLADAVLSTSGFCRYASREDVKGLIVGTEIGIIHRLRKENPGKLFIPASEQAVCPNMKLITLEKVLRSLETLSPVVSVPEEVRVRALKAVERMLSLA